MTWAYLRYPRVVDWTVNQIHLVWLSVPVAFYFLVLIEGLMTETILPLDSGYILQFAHGICFGLVATAAGVTLYWVGYGRGRGAAVNAGSHE